MAKAKSTGKQAAEGLTAAELLEVQTLEAAVVKDEAAERPVDEVVSEVFSAPEPADGESEVECFLREAREAQAVFGAGPISPDVLKSLVNRAVGLLG